MADQHEDALVERVAIETYSIHPNYTEDGDKVAWDDLTDAFRAWRCEEADSVIALVRQDERKRIAAALLSDGAVEAARNAGEVIPIGPDNAMVPLHNGVAAVVAALHHIGISTEDAQ